MLPAAQELKKHNHFPKTGDRCSIDIVKIFLRFRKLSRAALTITLALTVSFCFIEPLPVQALGIGITPPTAVTLGNVHSFTLTVSIPPTELLPINSVDLEIYNAADAGYKLTLSNLPLTNGGTASYSGSAGTLSVTTSTSNLQHFVGATYVSWQGKNYHFSPAIGYGYGNNSSQTASITYTGTWISPASWPGGGYIFKLSIVTDLTAFSQTSGPIAFFAPPSGTGGARIVTPGLVDVTQIVDTQGLFSQNVLVLSADTKVQLTLNKGTIGQTKDGGLYVLSITPMNSPPPPPAQASNIGLVYDLWPEEATFSPPINITFSYDPANIPAGWEEKKLKIVYFDRTLVKWVELSNVTVDPVMHTVSAKVSHFTAFTVLAYSPLTPSFTIGELVIAPPEVASGQTVQISSVVTNTGEISGNYTVTLEINKVIEATKNLTLAGGVSQTITFTTVKGDAGKYAVNINGQSGNFTVQAAKVLPEPAHFTIEGLSISPSEVDSGKNVTISALVRNTGNLSGNYQIILKINDAIEATQELTLAGGASETVNFATTKDTAGTHTVDLNNLNGSFIVREVPPGPPLLPPGVGLPWWVWVLITLGVIGIVASLVALARSPRAQG